MKEIRIGILGFGTVGAGVVEGIQQNDALLVERTGIRPVIGAIADLDITTNRGIHVDPDLLTTDAESVIEDERIDLVVELIGGCTAARELTLKALRKGKPVITANKALLATHGSELYQTAQEHHTGLYYEAAVGGGIPILRAQREGLVGNRITSIYGILNGTCNYILTRMERERLPFDIILEEAQKLGYAETPPDLDIDGIDTAHKAVILGAMAYGCPIPMEVCKTKGIRDLSQTEIAMADELGYHIKLLAIIKNINGQIELSVEPSLVPKNHMIASVNDVFNAVFVEGDIVGDTMYYGRGAGRLPTGSAVISDIMSAAADLIHGVGVPTSVKMMLQRSSLNYCGEGDIEKRCYVRLTLKDKPGTLAQVAEILGRNNISIASVLQKERHIDGYTPVVVLTHKAKESDYKAAFEEVDALEVIGAPTVRLRLEDFE